MRRQKKLYLRSFANGVLLAALPVAAFFGADYLLAPPAPGSTSVVSVSPSTGPGSADTSLSAASSPSPAQDRSPQASAVATATSGQDAAAGRKGGLVTAIQQELVRVGCYAGEPDGAWSERTRVAMQAFNTSVQVSLPTTSPDYILLTLLQGHSAKACSRSDKSIEVRKIAPPVAHSPNYASAPNGAPAPWTSTVVVAAPGKVATEVVVHSSVKTTVATAPKATPLDIRPIAEQSISAAPAPTQAGVNGLPDPTQGMSMDGRMAIGVLPPPQRDKTATQAVVRPRADSPAPRVQASAPARSPRSTFSDLARNAP